VGRPFGAKAFPRPGS